MAGKLSDERFASMSAMFDEEQQALRQEIVSLETALTADDARVEKVNRFIASVRQCPDIYELTPGIIHEFIERINVHESTGRGTNRTQRVDIVFNGVGSVDVARLELNNAV